MAGRWIEFPGDGERSVPAYVAVPQDGAGPPVLLLPDAAGRSAHMRDMADLYAEEGYAVLTPDLPRAEAEDTTAAVRTASAALETLRALAAATGKTGVLGFGRGATLAYLLAGRADIACAVAYCPESLDPAISPCCPTVFHIAEQDRLMAEETRARIRQLCADHKHVRLYLYPGCGHDFHAAEAPEFDKPATLMAHTRSLSLFREVLGPAYDLSALWERHTALEFASRDAEATMTTMVAAPYVNHVPTMTGGVGHDELLRFYKHHFIPTTPADARLVPISRTIGVDRLVDEFLFCFTHDIEIDWMLPGVPPIGKYVEIPMIAVVRFRGDKLHSEHIYWDQASVLVQIGLLDPANLPVAGIETARKLVDESLPSNKLMRRWRESERRAPD